MKISKYGHSAVLLETASDRILIDPGNFDNSWTSLRDLTAIVVTHQHADHADPVELPKLIAANPGVQVFVEPMVFDLVELPENTRGLKLGEKVHLSELTLETVGGRHAVIHSDYPRIGNLGMIFSGVSEPTFFHPGDSLEAIPTGVDVVAIPEMGPWSATKETIEFVREVKAAQGFFIHDGLLNERGRELIAKHVGVLAPETELIRIPTELRL